MIRLTRGVVCAALLLAALMPPTQAACNNDIPLTRPASRYVDNGDGTVTDLVTHLMWKQCAEGLSTTNANTPCDTGGAITFTWQAALQRAVDVNAGNVGERVTYDDWRVPNVKELRSLVEIACDHPAINATLFPATPAPFWTSSPAPFAESAWVTDFTSGDDVFVTKNTGAVGLRLVRSAD